MGLVSKFVFIDDDEIDQMGAERLMRIPSMNSRAWHFLCPVKALKAMMKNRPSDIGTIFLDINMPRLNGFEFLAEIEHSKRFKPEELDIYILSTSKREIEIRRAARSPYYRGWIEKPLTKERLLAIIASRNLMKNAHVSHTSKLLASRT